MITILDSQIEFVKNEHKFLNSNTDEIVIVILKETEAIYGSNDSCNIQWCKENNVKYIHQSKLQGGGCIIGVKGNLFIDIKKQICGGECLTDKFSKALTKYFKDKGLQSVRQDNNDVLIDNYKVASGCETIINDKYEYMGYQISIYQDLETIKHACNKPMIKIPKGLNEYGITTEEMKEFCINFWKHFQIH